MLPIVLLLTQPQSTPVDPDWLLSSTVQMAGVLVAIVGGFLVSRLVTMSAERGAIIQRRQHRDALREIKQAEYDDVHAERLEVSIEWFVDHHKEELLTQLLEQKDAADVESLLDDFIPRGSSLEEMRPVAEGLIGSTRAAIRDILEKFPSQQPPTTSRELRKSGVLIPEGSEGIYEFVADHIASIAERSMPRRAFDIPISSRITSRITPPIVYERQDSRIERERDLEIELRTLNSEVGLLDEELSAFSKPEGIKGAIAVLVYLTLAGIALPTVLMALRPVPDNALSRIAVVATFISGLVVLLAYLLLRVKSLRPPQSGRKPLLVTVPYCLRSLLECLHARSGLGDARQRHSANRRLRCWTCFCCPARRGPLHAAPLSPWSSSVSAFCDIPA